MRSSPVGVFAFDIPSPGLHFGRTLRTDEYPITLPAQPPPGGGVEFVLSLGQALHKHGTPAHRLEEAMRLVSAKLGLEGRFYSTPTAIVASFGKPEELRSCLLRTELGDIDLERVAGLDAIAEDVIQSRRTPTEGAQAVARLLSAPERYGRLIQFVCFTLAGAAGARLFGGGLIEIAVATVASLLVATLDRAARRSATLNRVLEAASGVVASAVASLAAAFVAPLSIQVTVLAALIVLLPGLSLTVATTELGTRNLISGTSRLMNAVVVFLQLGFGVALGARLTSVFPPLQGVAFAPLPAWTEGVAIAVLAFAITVLLKAGPRDLGWIALIGGASYLAARFGVGFFGPELSAFAGALVLGMLSNVLARFRNRPALVTIVPGLMLLVPGSIGFRSLESLMARDVIAGVGTAFSMVIVAVALAAGLLVANALVTPKKVL